MDVKMSRLVQHLDVDCNISAIFRDTSLPNQPPRGIDFQNECENAEVGATLKCQLQYFWGVVSTVSTFQSELKSHFGFKGLPPLECSWPCFQRKGQNIFSVMKRKYNPLLFCIIVKSHLDSLGCHTFLCFGTNRNILSLH